MLSAARRTDLGTSPRFSWSACSRAVVEPAVEDRAELPEAEILVAELKAFSVKITQAGNETFESWRERDHDDMVLAVAMALWLAERAPRGRLEIY